MSKNNVVHIDFAANRKRKKTSAIRSGVQAGMEAISHFEIKKSIVLRLLAVVSVLILSMLVL